MQCVRLNEMIRVGDEGKEIGGEGGGGGTFNVKQTLIRRLPEEARLMSVPVQNNACCLVQKTKVTDCCLRFYHTKTGK